MVVERELLLVEDIEEAREDTAYVLEHLHIKYQEFAHTRFKVTQASCLNEAIEKLQQKKLRLQSFHTTLVDLEIPVESDLLKPDVQNGYRLIELLKDSFQSCCGSVVVVSAHIELGNLIDVIQRGAADFIPKTDEEYQLYLRCLRASELAEARWEQQWRDYLKTRQRWGVEQARRESLDEIMHVCSRGVKDCLEHSDNLYKYIADRFGIVDYQGPQDEINKGFNELNSRLRKIAENLINTPSMKRQHALTASCLSTATVLLNEVVNQKLLDMSAGIVLKQIQIESDRATAIEVSCVRDDLGDVIEQILSTLLDLAQSNSVIELRTCAASESSPAKFTAKARIDGLKELVESQRYLRYARSIAANFGAQLEEHLTESILSLHLYLPE